MKKVIRVKPLENYMLFLEFDSTETRIFDVKPYLNIGNEVYFKNVRASLSSITWKNGQDFSPETLYLKSVASDLKVSSLNPISPVSGG